MADFDILGSQASGKAGRREGFGLKILSESENTGKVITSQKVEGAVGNINLKEAVQPQMRTEQIREKVRFLITEVEKKSQGSSPERRRDLKKVEPLLLTILLSGGGSTSQIPLDKVWLPVDFPTLEEHYGRNQNMPVDKLPQTIEEAERWNWDNHVAADCHQFTSKDKSNIKYVSPDGKCEVIFASDGSIVTAVEDYGTYNFADPKVDYIGHFYKDVLPWIIWGNTPDDSTTPEQRIDALVIGGGTSLAKKTVAARAGKEITRNGFAGRGRDS